MELKGERIIPATVEATWAALNDPEVLKGCIAGCESMERTGDDAYQAVVAVKVGPVSARFKGNLKMTTDFRLVYATMSKEWMGCADTKTLLKGDFPTLGLFA